MRPPMPRCQSLAGPRGNRLDSRDVRIVRCPSCRRDVSWEASPWRPFCSERCKLVDLAAWADERYRIPGEPVPTATEPGIRDDALPEPTPLRRH